MYTVKSLAWAAVLPALTNHLEWAAAIGRCQADEYEEEQGPFSLCYKVMSSTPVAQLESLQICQESAMHIMYPGLLAQLNAYAEAAKLGALRPAMKVLAHGFLTGERLPCRLTRPITRTWEPPCPTKEYHCMDRAGSVTRRYQCKRPCGERRTQLRESHEISRAKLDERDEQCVWRWRTRERLGLFLLRPWSRGQLHDALRHLYKRAGLKTQQQIAVRTQRSVGPKSCGRGQRSKYWVYSTCNISLIVV